MTQESPRAVVHIGLPKCGSTSIQNYLHRHRKQLRHVGVLYPMPLRMRSHHTEALLLRRVRDPESMLHWDRYATRTADKTPDGLARLRRHLERACLSRCATVRTCILSSEGFFSTLSKRADIEELAALLSGFSVKIVVYIRRIDQLAESQIRQVALAEEPISDRMIARCVNDIPEVTELLLERLPDWEAVFGKGSVVLRPFERESLEGGTPALDFLSVAGVEAPEARIQAGAADRSNIALTLSTLHFMGNCLTYPVSDRSRFEKAVTKALRSEALQSQLRAQDTTIISPYEQLELIRAQEPHYRALAEIYLGRSTLFNEPLPDPRARYTAFPGLTHESARPIYEHLLRQRAFPWPGRFTAKRFAGWPFFEPGAGTNPSASRTENASRGKPPKRAA